MLVCRMGVTRALGLTIAALALALGLGGCSSPKIVARSAKAETSQVQQIQDYEESERLAQERQDKTFDYYNSLGLDLPKLKVSDYQGFEQIKPDLEQKLGFEVPLPLRITDQIKYFTAKVTRGKSNAWDKLSVLHGVIYDSSDPDIKNMHSPSELTKQYFAAGKLSGACVSLSNLFIACALTIQEVQEAYLCIVIKDEDGKDYQIRHASERDGYAHACAIVKVNGQWKIIDVTRARGFDIQYQEVKLKNYVELVSNFIIGKGNEARWNGAEVSEQYKANENALKLNPDDTLALAFFVRSFPRELDSRAFLYACKMNDLEQNRFDSLTVLAYAYNRIGELDCALETITDSLHICSTFPPAYDVKSKILFNMKRYEEAKVAIEQALEIWPGKLEYESQLNSINWSLQKKQ